MSKKVYILNSSFLTSLYPCRPGLLWFEDNFPNGVVLTNNQQEMFKLCEKIIDSDSNPGSYLAWLCYALKWAIQLPQNKCFYFGSNPYGVSYGRPTPPDKQDELSSYEPEHCALIICQFVDEFGEVTKKCNHRLAVWVQMMEKVCASNRLSSAK